jgi:hypothetical protein
VQALVTPAQRFPSSVLHLGYAQDIFPPGNVHKQKKNIAP